jgi:hypothetical protein
MIRVYPCPYLKKAQILFNRVYPVKSLEVKMYYTYVIRAGNWENIKKNRI